MNDLEREVAAAVGAKRARTVQIIQSLWGGYGVAARLSLTGSAAVSAVVKQVEPPQETGLAHRRKLRSYAVEHSFYRDWSGRCDASCRVPEPLALKAQAGRWLFVLEDLNTAGFVGRAHHVDEAGLHACLRWLASFHGRFLGQSPDGLWPTGTYWHLATRPDELRRLPDGPLRDAAPHIDARLSAATYQTIVHGDAKPANFCFGSGGVAAVDFQYTGGGCGMKDLANLLSGASQAVVERGLVAYFRTLRRTMPERFDADAVEAEWRDLFAWAWADLHRFRAGWSPQRAVSAYERSLTARVLAAL